MKDFKTHFYTNVSKLKNSTHKKKKKKEQPNIPSKIILPGSHRTKQSINSNPGTADSPSSSTYQPKG